ncbi:methylcobalamin:coenzyme M methyltransferase [Oxobacter pfennigii]|uniref:Methylcobalamin:coenzyme M methyltransferase n=1 Tax=Oxobacter pfennigii TaxID=36849 RepID=A0A0P8WCH1_9CLOT|nr:uroporphyrinogen decarboxylase family protein [Oxobacter pfennigii]KPU45580.1 methylcobalamin:coenzyme M methyltransferase [Oxobacter pfennigii]
MYKSKLTPKENYMRILKGEMPEYVPVFTMGNPPWKGEPVYKNVGPFIFGMPAMTPPEGRYDIWGVHYVANEETGYGGIPEPNNFILEDITKWHQVIKAPKMPEVDWEQQAKKNYEFAKINLDESAACINVGFMPFQQLIAFMGFNSGLCALYEEPEYCKELLNYMADFYLPVIEKSVEYYKPDLVYFADDTAAKLNPFMSVEMFRDIFKPVYERILKPVNERGIPIQLHNCGRCEDFLDDMVELGVRVWDPAQPTNDLLSIKEKYKGKLAVAGCYEWVVPDTWPDADEEETRQGVRDAIDKYAPGGGFAIAANALGRIGDPDIAKINSWIKSEAYLYGRGYYIK